MAVFLEEGEAGTGDDEDVADISVRRI